jgi:polar amino acid transport system substrate-binding protein
VQRLLVVLLLLVACGAACGSEPSGNTLEDIKRRGEITWGSDIAGGEPYVYEDPEDTSRIIGFEVDIMEAIARRLGVVARRVQGHWPNLVPGLERGDFDVILNGLEATPERRDRILLSAPYFIYGQTLSIRKGDPYRSIFDLSGRAVGTLNQTQAVEILHLVAGIDTRLYEGNEEPYQDLERGRIDGVLLDNIIADRYGCTPKRPAVTCVPYDIARGEYVVGIRRSDAPLKAAIDGALEAMRTDGELERILRKANLWDHRQRDPDTGVGVRSASRAIDGDMVGQFIAAAWMTLQLSVLAFLIAVPLGVLLAIARVYGALPIRVAARVYIELFRGTPVLLQLYVLYYGLASVITLGPIQAGVLGLGLNYAAYEAEVYRGALLAIPRGQAEAARALGMSPWQTLRHVMVPQALRIALPPMTNDFVSMLKDSSIVGVFAVFELTKRMSVASAELRGWLLPGLMCAALYLLLSFPLSELARRLERRLARDQRPHAL